MVALVPKLETAVNPVAMTKHVFKATTRPDKTAVDTFNQSVHLLKNPVTGPVDVALGKDSKEKSKASSKPDTSDIKTLQDYLMAVLKDRNLNPELHDRLVLQLITQGQNPPGLSESGIVAQNQLAAQSQPTV